LLGEGKKIRVEFWDLIISVLGGIRTGIKYIEFRGGSRVGGGEGRHHLKCKERKKTKDRRWGLRNQVVVNWNLAFSVIKPIRREKISKRRKKEKKIPSIRGKKKQGASRGSRLQDQSLSL